MLHNIIKGVLLTIASLGCCGILVAGLIWLRSRTRTRLGSRTALWRG